MEPDVSDSEALSKIKNFLTELECEDLDHFSFTSGENIRLDALFDELQNVESVTKRLQKEGTTLSNVLDLLDSIIEDYLETECRLSSTADIVSKPHF